MARKPPAARPVTPNAGIAPPSPPPIEEADRDVPDATKGDDLDVFEIEAFQKFLNEALRLHDARRSLFYGGAPARKRLECLETQLKRCHLSVLTLFPWTSMLWDLKALGQWKRTPPRRGRRPKRRVTDILDLIATLMGAEEVSSETKLVLAGEHARLRDVLARGPVVLRAVPVGPVNPLRVSAANLSATLKRLDKWQPGHPPPDWPFLLRSHGMLKRGFPGWTEAARLRLLHELLALLFPQWWDKDTRKGVDRLKARLRYAARRFV